MRMTVADIAKSIAGEVEGDGSIEITGCAGIDDAKNGDITFLVHAKHLSQAQKSSASAVITSSQLSLSGKTVIKVDHPSLAFTKILNYFISQQPKGHPKGVHAAAIIAPGVQLGKDVSVGAYAVIESGAFLFSTHCSSAAIGSKRSVPSPPRQCAIPGTMNSR